MTNRVVTQGPALREAVIQANRMALAMPCSDPCHVCESSPTVAYRLIGKDGITFMEFEVCYDCIRIYGLVKDRV